MIYQFAKDGLIFAAIDKNFASVSTGEGKNIFGY
jgi:hypothetical protein